MTYNFIFILVISVISGRSEGDTCNEKLCAKESHLRLRFLTGIEARTARSAGQRFTYLASGVFKRK